MEPITFKVGRNTFVVDKGDWFMDNGSIIQFMPVDKGKLPNKRRGLMSWKPTVAPKAKDWERIKPLLTSVPHKWGKDVTVYQLK